MTAAPRRALVRDVPDSFDACLKNPAFAQRSIDVARARSQHAAYRAALAAAGLEVIALPADPGHPDCCFVEDTALVADDLAVILPLGTPERVGEEGPVRDALARFLAVRELTPPARIDGGDVLRLGRTLHVGLTARTNMEACRQLREIVAPRGLEVAPVPVTGILHLKSAVTALPEGRLLVSPGHVPAGSFEGCGIVEIAPGEEYAANCLAVGQTVLFAAGHPHTATRLRGEGLKLVELEMSEFRLANGSLTCLSILL
jgi:dimethylargininase